VSEVDIREVGERTFQFTRPVGRGARAQGAETSSATVANWSSIKQLRNYSVLVGHVPGVGAQISGGNPPCDLLLHVLRI